MSVMTDQTGRRFQNSDILRMFPTFVWLYEPINDSVLQSLGQFGAPLADLKPGESWQSDTTGCMN